MTLEQLRTFLAVARRGSVNAAAAELVVTQPAVSAAVAALERQVGVALLVREGRGIRLTPSGEALARYAAEALGLLEQGTAAAATAADPRHGRLRIAAVTTAGEYVVPPIIKAFRSRYPEVELHLEVGNRAIVLELLRDRRADVAVAGRPPEASGLDGRPFLSNDLVLVASPDHPFARRRSIDPRTLEDPWLLREPGSGTAATTEEYLAQGGVEPRTILRVGSNGAVKQAAAVGLGVTLISAHAVSLELGTGTLVRLRARGTPVKRRWFALCPARGFLPGPARGFLDFVQGEAARRAVAAAMRAPRR